MSLLDGLKPVRKMKAHLNSVFVRKPFADSSYFAKVCSRVETAVVVLVLLYAAAA